MKSPHYSWQMIPSLQSIDVAGCCTHLSPSPSIYSSSWGAILAISKLALATSFPETYNNAPQTTHIPNHLLCWLGLIHWRENVLADYWCYSMIKLLFTDVPVTLSSGLRHHSIFYFLMFISFTSLKENRTRPHAGGAQTWVHPHVSCLLYHCGIWFETRGSKATLCDRVDEKFTMVGWQTTGHRLWRHTYFFTSTVHCSVHWLVLGRGACTVVFTDWLYGKGGGACTVVFIGWLYGKGGARGGWVLCWCGGGPPAKKIKLPLK